MARLFTPLALKDLVLENRIVVSPMAQYSAVDGEPQPWHLQHYGSLAASGPGLVVMEATGCTPEGRITPYCGFFIGSYPTAWVCITTDRKQHSSS